MRLIRGGPFAMGSENGYPDERPVRPATTGDFWIDEAPVTNAQFANFIAATGHITFAEYPPDPADYPGMLPELAVAGSIVFSPPSVAADLDGPPVWWRFVPGACWHAPYGPDSDLIKLADHPVVHVGPGDAEAYAHWCGKMLPTETEWEFAARGGLDGAEYAWGDAFEPDGRSMAKTWSGIFPTDNRAPAGLERTAPVRSYPPNGYGLYDMIGNVWEWTADAYITPGSAADGETPRCCGAARPDGEHKRRVLKGGSHLCAPNYCRRYRPAARWPQPIDTTTSHIGFRCIIRR